MNQPIIHSSVFVAPGAFVTGDVVIGENSSVWYNAVLRGDMAQITIGKNTNVQDGCILHTDPGSPLRLGDYVTVGHGAILHGCTVQEGSLVGMGAIILDGRRHWQKLPGWGRRAGDAQNSRARRFPGLGQPGKN
ncbi:MAG: gamma carbonic anhydrase family protein [Hydrogeniiclostridium mannosilyticum]